MELKKSFTIDGVVVEETNKTVAGHKVYMNENSEYEDDLTLYLVDKDMKVRSVLKVEADMGQGTGYVSDWNVKNF